MVQEALNIDHKDTADQLRARAEGIRQDVLKNHLPRVMEGLESGYVDENQMLVVYDHLVRIRTLCEIAASIEKGQ